MCAQMNVKIIRVLQPSNSSRLCGMPQKLESIYNLYRFFYSVYIPPIVFKHDCDIRLMCSRLRENALRRADIKCPRRNASDNDRV